MKWVWLHVPLDAIVRAIRALKDRVIMSHISDNRDEAHVEDLAAESIKEAVQNRDETRDENRGPD
jgi:phosphoribosyl 1,2-cyclic phosphodiesterase